MQKLLEYTVPTEVDTYDKRMEYYRTIASRAYREIGLEAASRSFNDYSGYLTVEKAPQGSYSKQDIVKVVLYENDPQTRWGYFAKFKITEHGLEDM